MVSQWRFKGKQIVHDGSLKCLQWRLVCKSRKLLMECVTVVNSRRSMYMLKSMNICTVAFVRWIYCIISFNSAGPVTRDGPAEVLVSTTSQNHHDKPKFWELFGSLAPQATNFFINLSHDHQMNSAPNKNYCDYRDI